MRTTLDLNDALLSRAKVEAARAGKTLTRFIEEALTERLDTAADHAPSGPRPFLWKVYDGSGGLRPGIDPTSNASLLEAADELWMLQQAGLVPFDGEDG